MAVFQTVTHIRGGTVWTAEGPVKADIQITEEGRIGAITPRRGDDQPAPGDGASVVDARELWVLPGGVDVHVHFRDPGYPDKEDFTTGSIAAAAAGITTVLDMPNTLPPVADGSLLERKKAIIEGRSAVDYGLFGVLADGPDSDRGGDVAPYLDRVYELLDAGACGIKVFLGPTTGNIRAPDWGILYQVCRHFSGTDVTFTFHCEDRAVIETASLEAAAGTSSGQYSALLQSRPRFGELMATDAVLRLALETGAKVHIAHVALKEAVPPIAAAKKAGAHISAETCPQYLFVTDADYPRLGSMMKVLPPIREADDQAALWDGLKTGVIDCIATDHAPHQRDESPAPDESPLTGPFGCAGVETLLPIMLDAAIEGRCSVDQVVRWCAHNPASIYGLRGKGALRPGADADIVLCDPARAWRVTADSWRGKSRNSPFWGRTGRGAPVMALLRGHVVGDSRGADEPRLSGRFLPVGSSGQGKTRRG